MTSTPVFTQTPKTGGGSINNATGAGTLGSDTNGVALYTAGSNGSRVNSLILSTTDTTANDVFLYIKSGANIYPVGQVHVPASSGNIASTLAIDGILPSITVGLPIDNNGKRFIHLGASDVLKFAVIAAVTSGKTLYGSVMAEDY